MTQKTADEIRSAVSAAYGARARGVSETDARECCADDCCRDASVPSQTARFYDPAEAAEMPDTVVSYGCGNPTAIAGLTTGETVLDLGSGAGLDCFLSARQVGHEGRVIGVDMTDEMLALAESNRLKLGAANVEFRKGMLEALPIADGEVDVIISNCVINLSPDKDAVFCEAFRVLRTGARLHVSDVVLLKELSAVEQEDLNLWAGCISGALPVDDYAERLVAAGFTDVEIELAAVAEGDDAKPYRSALITARKPGSVASPRPRPVRETIELLAPAGLATAACCGPAAADPERCC